MTDDQFDLLDELYFVQSFDYLQETLEWAEVRLKETLKSLIEKGWVKCYQSSKAEIILEDIDFDEFHTHCFYLATKAGLLAHNGR